jgi:ADP-dependent phosphofructokinase/glucokinase
MDEGSLEAALATLADYPVFLAYNANVDAIVRVDERLEAVLDPPERDRTPERLDSPAELSAAIAATMREGEGDELPMDDDLGRLLADRIDPDEQRLGGQAGIMTDVLAVLGAAPVFYTYLLSQRQRATFDAPERVRVPVVDDGDLQFVPLEAAPPADYTKVNYIFEFHEDARFYGATAAGDTRLIAAARPQRFNLELGPLASHVGTIGGRVECALLSGYHSLRPEYDDGTTFRDRLESGRATLRSLRSNRDLTVQVELGVTHYPDLREGIREYVVPEADAVGVDSRELDQASDDLGIEVPPSEAGGGPPVVRRHSQLAAVREAFGVPAVKFHARDYFLAATDGYLPAPAVRRGYEFAAVLAATKASEGPIRSSETLRRGLHYPPADAGTDAVGRLADHLGVELTDGAVVTDEVVAVPNRVVEDPVATVGLGDTVSAASFAFECALADQEPAGGGERKTGSGV